MKLLYYFFLSSLILWNKGYAQSSFTLIGDAAKSVDTGFVYLEDPTASLSINNILSEDRRFTKIEKVISVGEQEKTYWLKFFLKNGDNYDKEWILDFQGWSYVNSYLIQNNSAYDSTKTGHLLPYSKRNVPIANKCYLKVLIKAGQESEFIVRVQHQFNNDLKPNRLGFDISPASLVDKRAGNIEKGIYAFLAVILFMFIYVLFLFAKTRQKKYAYYLLVICFAFYHSSYNSGHLIQTFGFLDLLPLWLIHFEKISSNLYGISVLLFIHEFFKVGDRYPLWSRITKTLLLLFVLSSILLFISYKPGNAFSQILAPLTIITIISIAVKSVRDHYPSSAFMLVGYLATCVSTILILINVDERTQNELTFTFAMPVGSTVELVFFALALANMIKFLQLEQEKGISERQRIMQEKEELKSVFDKEILKTKLEIQEQTLHDISEELHDNIGQKLILTKMNIHNIEAAVNDTAKEKLNESKDLLIDAIQDLRDISKTLNSDFIKVKGLIGAIEQQLQIVRRASAYETELQVSADVYSLDEKRELIAFRIVQELLNNILKHAEGQKILIDISYLKDKVLIKVQDDGKGFEMAQQQLLNQGLGLENIKNRTQLIGGSILFESKAQLGTLVILEIPNNPLRYDSPQIG